MSFDQKPVDSPMDWVADHVRRYIETNGEEGHIWRGVPTLILTTIGRRSGTPRRLALIYGEDEAGYVVVASKGGSDEHPDWYRNLLAQPEVEVQVKADRFRAHARTATPAEHARLWPHMVAIWPDYARYQERTSRQIPLVVLERL